MRTCGLLVLERRGRFRYYRADAEALGTVAERLGELRLTPRRAGRHG